MVRIDGNVPMNSVKSEKQDLRPQHALAATTVLARAKQTERHLIFLFVVYFIF